MQIKLKNIGIIKDSTLTLDGLTVITGKNNSGKTTVGKTLYALLDAVCDIQQKAKRDRNSYIGKQLSNVENAIGLFNILVIPGENDSPLLSNYPALEFLFSKTGTYQKEFLGHNLENFAHKLAYELETFDLSILESDTASKILQLYKAFSGGMGERESNSFFHTFEDERDEAISILKKLFDELDKDLDLVNYTRESINQTMRLEFANQIQPVKTPEVLSRIILSGEDVDYIDCSFADNYIVNDGTRVFFTSPFKRVYLIDDPFILDDISHVIANPITDDSPPETFFDPHRINSHNYKLERELRDPSGLSVFEQTILQDSLAAVKKQIDAVIPGTFEFTSEGKYYVQNGAKLKLCNLATGSKMFSIIKILLEKGTLDSGTMLILDEPEAHLHPQWQNAFAEVMVLLVKELNVTVLLTTHSPNFMLALDAYMRKYDISDKSNFYQTEFLSDGFVQYQCVNDDMGKIYQDFLQYLSEVKVLRGKYLHGMGEEP